MRFPIVDALLIVAVILPFFSFLIKKRKHFVLSRNGLVIIIIAMSLYSLIRLWNFAERISIFFSGLFLFFGLLTVVHSFKREMDSKFYSLFLFALAGLVGISFAKDFFSLWVFWELMLISSYALISFGKSEKVGAALKYIFMSVAGSACLLFAISLLYGSAGTVNFSDLSNVAGTPLKIITALVIAGFGVEAVLFPFHFWAPDVYQSADNTVSAFFASVLSKAGIFGLIRILSLIPLTWSQALAFLALLSATFGSFLALIQVNLKRLLAFASMSHLGFIVFSLCLGTTDGLIAGLFHALNHAILMVSLFFCLDVFPNTNLRKLKVIPSLYKPIFIIALLATSGMPPFNGFMSEFLILRSSINSGWILPSILLLFNMFLILAVFLKIIKNFSQLKTEATRVNLYSMLPLLISLLLIIGFGIYPNPILDILRKVVS